MDLLASSLRRPALALAPYKTAAEEITGSTAGRPANAWSVLIAPADEAAIWDSLIRIGYGSADECGAFRTVLDDFLIEPWTAAELLLRIRKLAARDNATIHPPALPRWAPALQRELYTLLSAAPVPVSRHVIAAELNLRGSPDSRAVDMLVARLRKTLRDADSPCFVQTIRGVGYRLNCG